MATKHFYFIYFLFIHLFTFVHIWCKHGKGCGKMRGASTASLMMAPVNRPCITCGRSTGL